MSSVTEPGTITRAGQQRLEAELQRLVAERPRLAAELRTERQERSEQDDITMAFTAQVALDRRIDALRSALATARVVEPPPDGVAGLGQTVMIEVEGRAGPVTYHLVGEIEADAAARRLSVESPIGHALVGLRAGDTVEVDTPGGTRLVRVLEVGSSV
jgi:transcription elongation factor GreA